MPPTKRLKKDAESSTQPTRTQPTRSSARLRDKANEAPPSSHATASAPAPPSSKGAVSATSPKKAATGKAPSSSLPNKRAKKAGTGKADTVKVAVKVAPTFSKQKPSLLWVNEDCLHEVCSYLGTGDLNKVLTVNRAFYNAATPRLYRVLWQREGCLCHGLYDRNGELASKYTTAIEFFPHSHRTHLPRLQSGRITTHIVNYDWNDKSTEEDKHGRTAAWGTHKCPHCPKAPAPPQRLVLRPVYTALDFKKKADRKPKRVVVPVGTKCADKIVHISLNMGKAVFSAQPRYVAHAKPVTPSKRLTFVILPAFWDCGPVTMDTARPHLLGSLRESLSGLVLNLHDHSIHIVGLEACDPFGPEWDWQTREAREKNSIPQFKSELDRRLGWWPILDSWSDEDKNRVRDKVTYQTFRDYLKSGDWGEEFSWQLVGRWLNALDARESGLMTTPVLALSRAEKAAAKKAAKKAANKRKRKRKWDTETESESEWDSAENASDNEKSFVKVEADDSEEEDY